MNCHHFEELLVSALFDLGWFCSCVLSFEARVDAPSHAFFSRLHVLSLDSSLTRLGLDAAAFCMMNENVTTMSRQPGCRWQKVTKTSLNIGINKCRPPTKMVGNFSQEKCIFNIAVVSLGHSLQKQYQVICYACLRSAIVPVLSTLS